ncbi:MAG TPA: MYXO-CTERM sorting domain-containing protein [Kofleriaceae bacterium]
MRAVGAICVLGVLAWSSAAVAETELKNDGFVTNGTAGFQGGFHNNEIGASRFVAPAAGRQLLKVQLLFGGATAQRTITLKVWDDTAGGNAPGGELYTGDFQMTGSDSAMQEINLVVDNVIVPAQFRVGILMQCSVDPCGYPSIARDADGLNAPDKNYLMESSLGWQRSATFGLNGDWIIRAFITDGGGATSDGGVDAGVTGGACNGNAECPGGQFCDLANHACTFECRSAEDCGGGTCNSLGMCVGGGDRDASGCCRVESNGDVGVWVVLGVGVLLVIVRRRRS